MSTELNCSKNGMLADKKKGDSKRVIYIILVKLVEIVKVIGSLQWCICINELAPL